MKRLLFSLALIAALLAGCGPYGAVLSRATPTNTALPSASPTTTDTPTPLPTATETASPTPAYPAEGYGPTNFPANVDPLTGLEVANPALLDRRPMLIKIQNLPRNSRPQWGASLADIVYEYYTEEGTTRFAAIFLGNDADKVGPIRSGRFIDTNLVDGYKAVFAFGYAYQAEMSRFLRSDFANRLVLEGPGVPYQRYDPNGFNYLLINTADMSTYATQKNMDNTRQNLDGMFFQLQAPAGGQPGTSFIVRYSGSIYNRWDYDATSGKYLRFSDTADAFTPGDAEKYAQLTDHLTGQPIADDNVVILKVNHELYSPGIYDILFSGTGDGWAYRDGQVYQVKWQRNPTDVLSLTNPDGSPFAFKLGNTWVEIVGLNTTVAQEAAGLRFTHLMP